MARQSPVRTLDGVDAKVKGIYEALKLAMSQFKPSLRFNPQKYYISIVDKKNLAYIAIRKRKLRITIVLPEAAVRGVVKHHTVQTLSEGVRKFYGGDCCEVIIEDDSNLGEVIDALKLAVTKNT